MNAGLGKATASVMQLLVPLVIIIGVFGGTHGNYPMTLRYGSRTKELCGWRSCHNCNRNLVRDARYRQFEILIQGTVGDYQPQA